jgi:hypothetical protein
METVHQHRLLQRLPAVGRRMPRVIFWVQGVISPLLANIFMHYALDLWVHQWRKRYARGRVIIVRYCDDFVLGFEHEADARRMRADLKERLAKFKLALHEEKTRLIEFGRRPSELRRKHGARRCETFRFLGFTHYCAWSREGRFVVKRRTDRMRLTRKLQELSIQARRRMHTPVVLQYQWLCSVLRGHYAYFGLPSNWDRLGAFYQETRRIAFGRLIAAASVGSHGSVMSGCSNVSLYPFHASPILDRWPLADSGQTSGGAECGKSARSDL